MHMYIYNVHVYMNADLCHHESGGEGGVKTRWSADFFTGIGMEEHSLIKVTISQHTHLVLSIQSPSS